MLTHTNEKEIDMICENTRVEPTMTPTLQDLDNHQYLDIIYLLLHLTCPDHLKGHKRRALRLKTARYCLTQEGLGWRNVNGIILRCINEQDSRKILTEIHSRFCGGHFVANTTAHTILRAGYYWPTIFVDVHKHVKCCQECQLFMGKQKLVALRLTPVVVLASFQQWGLNFIGKFKDNFSNGFCWIITATDYFTKWVEAIPTKTAMEKFVMDFTEDKIIT